MKKLAVVLAMLLASACTTISGDGYKFGNKEYEQNNLQVKIVVYKSIRDLQISAAKHKVTADDKTAAFSVLQEIPHNNVCTIHILDPKIGYWPQFIGHELTHCIYGRWHKEIK